MKRFKLLLFLLIAGCCMTKTIEAKDKKYKNGDFYSGEWKKGKPEGKGKMVFANSSIYDGLWHDGKIAGEGIFEGAGSKFEGTFIPVYENEDLVNFKPVRGTLTTTDAKLSGEWDEQNLFHGILTNKEMSFKGILDLDNSIFKEGRIDGMDGSYIEGTMLLTPQFEGKVSKFVLQKSSVLDVPAVYTGEFTKGNFLGHISGSQYSNSINEFEIDIYENGNQFGNIVLKNGGKYRGYIKNKDFNGEGFLEMKDGYFHGIWSNGILTDGNIKQWDTNGNKYEFSVNGRKATYTFPIGDTFPNGETITITGIPNGYNKLYSEVVKYEANYKEEQENIRRQEALKKQEEEERLAREKAIKEIDSNYKGLIFYGEGSLMTLSGDMGVALIGALLGSTMTQTLYVTFMPGGKVNIRERDSNTTSPDPNRLSQSQLLAAAMNSSSGHTYNAYIEDDKIVLKQDLYLKVSKDKKTLVIYGPAAAYKLKRR